MRTLTRTLLAGLAMVGLIASIPAMTAAQQHGVGGRWTMTADGHALTLSLTQNDKTITGTLDSPHGAVPLKGEIAGGTFTFSGKSDFAEHPLEVSVKGSVQEDGSLAGTLTSNVGNMNWSAVRDPKPADAATGK
jgi:hypothetical protein